MEPYFEPTVPGRLESWQLLIGLCYLQSAPFQCTYLVCDLQPCFLGQCQSFCNNTEEPGITSDVNHVLRFNICLTSSLITSISNEYETFSSDLWQEIRLIGHLFVNLFILFIQQLLSTYYCALEMTVVNKTHSLFSRTRSWVTRRNVTLHLISRYDYSLSTPQMPPLII